MRKKGPSVNSFDRHPSYWHAITKQDFSFNGIFLYANRMRKTCCHPSCNSKKQENYIMENFTWFKDVQEAQSAGYKPCKRCHADEPHYISPKQRTLHLKILINRFVRQNHRTPSLVHLGTELGVSKYHLHRTNKIDGLTIKKYSQKVYKKCFGKAKPRRRQPSKPAAADEFSSKLFKLVQIVTNEGLVVEDDNVEIFSSANENTNAFNSLDYQERYKSPASVLLTDELDMNMESYGASNSFDTLETDDLTSSCDFSQYLELSLESPAQNLNQLFSPVNEDLNRCSDSDQRDLLQEMESICSLQLPHVGSIHTEQLDQIGDLSSLFQLSKQDKSHDFFTLETLPQAVDSTKLDLSWGTLPLPSPFTAAKAPAVIDPILTSFTSLILMILKCNIQSLLSLPAVLQKCSHQPMNLFVSQLHSSLFQRRTIRSLYLINCWKVYWTKMCMEMKRFKLELPLLMNSMKTYLGCTSIFYQTSSSFPLFHASLGINHSCFS